MNKIKTALVVSIFITVGLSIQTARATQESVVTVIGGVIRSDNSGNWALINDDTHKAIGLSNPTCLRNGNLKIPLTTPRNDFIGTAWASADETYAVHGITSGASVRKDAITISFARNNHKISCRSRMLRIAQSNVWVGAMYRT